MKTGGGGGGRGFSPPPPFFYWGGGGGIAGRKVSRFLNLFFHISSLDVYGAPFLMGLTVNLVSFLNFLRLQVFLEGSSLTPLFAMRCKRVHSYGSYR